MAESRRERRSLGTGKVLGRAKSAGKGAGRSGILLGIAGALIASLLVYQVFLKSDGDSESSSLGAPPAAGAPAAAGTTTTTAALEPELPNGSFDDLTLRDPFEPQVSTGGTGSTTDTTTTTQPTTDTTFPTTATTSPAQNPAASTQVALLDVTDVNGVQTARVRVGDTEYTVVAGQTFGPSNNYVLVAFTSATCANFTYADSPFSLCTGEQVIK
jgi:hypothetical protein